MSAFFISFLLAEICASLNSFIVPPNWLREFGCFKLETQRKEYTQQTAWVNGRDRLFNCSRISSSLLESEHDPFGSKVSYILVSISGQRENKVFINWCLFSLNFVKPGTPLKSTSELHSITKRNNYKEKLRNFIWRSYSSKFSTMITVFLFFYKMTH